MENIGTWNSDLLFIFTAALLLPIVIYFVGVIVSSIESNQIGDFKSEDEAWDHIKRSAMQSAIEGNADARDWVTENVYTPKRKPVPCAKPVKTTIVHKTNVTSKPKVKRVVTKSTSKPATKPAPKPAPKPTPKPKNTTATDTSKEAVQGLFSLGFRKKEAVSAVNLLVKGKSYKKAEDIINDVFAKKS